MICPDFAYRLRTHLGVVLPKAHIRHYVLQELLQVVGVRPGVPPVAVPVLSNGWELPHGFE